MLNAMGKAARAAAYELALLDSARKTQLLEALADALLADAMLGEQSTIFQANCLDTDSAVQAGLSAAMQDRLLLNEARLLALIEDVRRVARLPDPVGRIWDDRQLPSGLQLCKMAVPLGVVAVIYEARPNVTIDVATLCLKTGNAVILRGGKETKHTNLALMQLIEKVLVAEQLPAAAVQMIADPDRALVMALLKLDKYVDMLIPRGGAALQTLCQTEATMPVILGGIGVCHIFVDDSANLTASAQLIRNAKVQRPTVCNAVETVLIHAAIAPTLLPLLAEALPEVVLHACPLSLPFLPVDTNVEPLLASNLDREFLALALNVLVVADVTAAMVYIAEHGTGHSEAILTETPAHGHQFQMGVDAAVVYVNASTRFSDGGEFGLGAEVAVSTQKLHARGPMALEALTTYKWLGQGQYTIRQG